MGIALMTYSLFPGGYLVLDKEEKTPLPEAYYVRAWKEENIYRCIEHALPVSRSTTAATVSSQASNRAEQWDVPERATTPTGRACQ